jgi:hypothetical protein
LCDAKLRVLSPKKPINSVLPKLFSVSVRDSLRRGYIALTPTMHTVTGFLDFFHHPILKKKVQTPVILCVIHNRQNPLESTYTQQCWCLPRHPRVEADPVSETSCSLVSLEYRRMGKIELVYFPGEFK